MKYVCLHLLMGWVRQAVFRYELELFKLRRSTVFTYREDMLMPLQSCRLLFFLSCLAPTQHCSGYSPASIIGQGYDSHDPCVWSGLAKQYTHTHRLDGKVVISPTEGNKICSCGRWHRDSGLCLFPQCLPFYCDSPVGSPLRHNITSLQLACRFEGRRSPRALRQKTAPSSHRGTDNLWGGWL